MSEWVIAQDGSLYAINKPAGLRVHRAGDDGADDLMAALARAGLPAGIAPIHRLDAPVSGVVLCSADPEVRAQVSGWLAGHEVGKVYLALVLGRTRNKGIIRRALADGRRGRPLDAVTRWRCLERLGPVSLLEVRPETGRKHQIRKHLQGIGHGIVGDELYRPKQFRAVPGFPGRLWLHAARIEAPDGRVWSAPLPGELVDHLALLRERARVKAGEGSEAQGAGKGIGRGAGKAGSVASEPGESGESGESGELGESGEP